MRRLRFKSFLGDEAGAALILFALSLPVLVALSGLAVDVGLWYTKKRELQTVADSAALAAGWEKARGATTAVAQAAALTEARRNGYSAGNGAALAVNSPPTSGSRSGSNLAAEAIVEEPTELFFSTAIVDQQFMIRARSVAELQSVGVVCVLALDTTADRAADFTGNTASNFSDCIVAANSTSASAIRIGGSGSLSAYTLWTAGNISGQATTTIDPTERGIAIADPYANLAISSFAGCLQTNYAINPGQTITLVPGAYCNGLDIRGTAHLTPGTYLIDQGDLTVNATAVVDCPGCTGGTGVTFILTRRAGQPASQIGGARINGGATVTLVAPQSGDYAGILFYQDRRASNGPSGVDRFNGGSTMSLSGALYFPSQEVDFNGNNGAVLSNCTQIVAREITFSGASNASHNGCDGQGVTAIHAQRVQLVE